MVLEDRWLRETYVDLLIEYAAKNKDIVILEADLMKAGGTFRFAEKYPERTFDVGIQEANMIGTAAGMSAMGKIPFTHTFTAFATRRVCDQVTLSVAYAGLNVKMMGSDPGVTAEYNGGTHMSMEDVSIMRNIPGMIVYEPVDSAGNQKNNNVDHSTTNGNMEQFTNNGCHQRCCHAKCGSSTSKKCKHS